MEATKTPLTSTRNCPICDSAKHKHLFHQSFAQLQGAALMAAYDVVICDTCGLAYADGIPDQSVFDRYYRDQSKFEHAHRGGSESAEDEQRHLDVISSFEQFVLSKEARILEIGCATGQLLAFLRQKELKASRGWIPHLNALAPLGICTKSL